MSGNFDSTSAAGASNYRAPCRPCCSLAKISYSIIKLALYQYEEDIVYKNSS